MAGYQPLKITGNTEGLIQQREEFLLPNDAYPRLSNAYVWREKILRKKGYLLLGRLQRNFEDVFMGANSIGVVNFYQNINYVAAVTNALNGVVTTKSRHNLVTGDTVGFSNVSGMIQLNGNGYLITVLTPTTFQLNVDTSAFGVYTTGGIIVGGTYPYAPLRTLVPGSVIITASVSGDIYTDNGLGVLVTNGAGANGTINYATGSATLPIAVASSYTATFSYYPGLPVMGIRTRELQNSANDQTLFFDQVYCYVFDSAINAFKEFIPGVYWNNQLEPVSGTSFFFSTNYWTSTTTIPGTATPFFTTSNQKLFWVTNNTGVFGVNADPIRITDGVSWYPFYDDVTPANTPWAQIDATNYLVNALAMLPFRGRMLMFNTWEGTNATGALNYSNRIRWCTIGSPFIPYSAGTPATGSWRDDIRGQGGFLDIPTSEDIVAVGFVRDNLVIYCERSTWQLRYNGRSISPFQIERVNSELGSESPFSAIQFDTSLVGIGDKGIVECDSYKSERIDIKIPDFVFESQNTNNGAFRIHGVRDFINRLAFWTFPLSSSYDPSLSSTDKIFPNTRLVYNYENGSWATFTDSLTAMGTYQPQSSRTWLNTKLPWIRCNFSWTGSQQTGQPSIVGGNQQGFIEYLDEVTTNDASLFIANITGNTTTPTVIESPNHNLSTGFVIGISGIPAGSPFDNLNDEVFAVIVIDKDNFRLVKYDFATDAFSLPQLDDPATFIGGGVINIRDNFSIVSKKFNFLDEGQAIQLGYLDVLLEASDRNNPGAISLKVYLDYNDAAASNTSPQNEVYDYSPVSNPDTFFNSVIPTAQPELNNVGGSKFWQRVYCATRANFLTLEYTFSNRQMAGTDQEKEVQIDAQVLWIRRSGRMTSI